MVGLLAHCPVIAGDLDKLVVFDIRAETLDKALLEFGAQAHVQLSFVPDSITLTLRIPKLKGRYTGKAALAKLLRGTGLRYVTHAQTVEIVPIDQSRMPVPQRPPSSAYEQQGAKRFASGIQASTGDPTNQDKNAKHSSLSEIVITGSRLPVTDREGPQEVQTYDRRDIDQSGQTSISGFLATLPSVSLTSPSSATARELVSTVALRGLPVGTTLVLLDGRRLEGSGLANWSGGGDFFDLNNIPLDAVQKIEVDQNGSSAVYGSDAIGGVVNIILKQDFDNLEVNAKYSWAKDLPSESADFAWGKRWGRGGFSVVGSYERDGGFTNSDRLLSASNNYTDIGGPDNNYPACSPGNVFSTNGSSLPGAPAGSQATYAAISQSAAKGRPALSQFTYGSLNECSILAGLSLLPDRRRAGLFSQGHLDISQGLELFTEVIYTHMKEDVSDGYEQLFGVPAFQEYTVSASNPFNPFGTTVGIAASLSDVPEADLYTTDFFRPLVGLRGTISGGWRWEASIWQSTDWTEDLEPNYLPNAVAIQGALNSADSATALNPFAPGQAGSRALLASLFGAGKLKMMGRDRSAEAFVRGPVVRLPAGNVQAVIGGDYDRTALSFNVINNGIEAPNTRFNYNRTYRALFAEVRIPVLARSAATQSTLLAITAAGRHDQYSDIGGANTEQFGVEIRPASGLLLRGTYADAFMAPTLPDLYFPQESVQALVTDPLTGEPAFVRDISGGNPNIRPLTGRSRTLGLVYSLPVARSAVLSVTQWHVVENSAIQTVAPQVIVDNSDVFSGRVIRNPDGSIAQVIDTDVNFGSIDVAGIDYQLAYRLPLAGGTALIDSNATQTYHYTQALTPGMSPLEAVSKAENDSNWAPRWKGTIGAGWQGRSFTMHMDGRYTGAYQDYGGVGVIGNIWLVDANVKVALGRALGLGRSWLNSSYIEAGATNLLNRSPQFSNYDYDLFGYDAAQINIVGRTLYIQAGMDW